MTTLTTESMRAQVADSWHLSAAAGVDAETAQAPITLEASDLRDHREAHPLARVFPLLDDVLGQAARECGAIMAVSDASGQLLWVCGTPSMLRKAERIGFVEGSNWDERMAGTNAPGMALRLGQSVLVRGYEHFRRSVQQWSCAATPILDPASSTLLGVLDVTGGDDIAVPQTTAMVRAAARMAEAELARELLSGGPQQLAGAAGLQVGIELLGRHEALVSVSTPARRGTPIRLTPRHSEIVLLLGTASHGLSGDELAVLLYEDDGASSTLRAELNRLRHLLGDELLLSRPYRLATTIAGDWLAVEAQLAAGDLRAALRGYRGPVLPRSTAPGVVRLRERLHHSLRAALLASREADLMSAWARTAWGADDYEVWLAQRDVIAPASPMRALVEGQIARLDRELA